WKEDELLVPWCRERVALNLGKSDKQQLHPFGPGYIFRAGVKQITGLPIRGVLWYQGESNAEKPDQYRLLFPKMVQSWRRSWQQEQLPFLVVQLSSIQRPGWEQFRDMQRSLSEEIPHCSLVVSSDLGDSLNVHPIRKKEIGERLAAQVLTSLYGLHNYRISPRPVSAKVQGQTIVVSFDPVSPLTTRDGKSVRELEMSDEMGCFVPVQGEIQDNQLILAKRHSSQGTIRYGWKPFSRGNLVSSGMLPVSTFQIHYNSEISNHWHYGKI
ncbi:MAG: sialate O-acetylesterase, partial [Marinilabiliales bacterium]|nr:sialate O-acetylesterase [Marinilabiliales bacterium]